MDPFFHPHSSLPPENPKTMLKKWAIVFGAVAGIGLLAVTASNVFSQASEDYRPENYTCPEGTTGPHRRSLPSPGGFWIGGYSEPYCHKGFWKGDIPALRR